ncbi:hypothetical protein GGI43DRAFT_270357 [Trichoderma evansii]
MSAWLALPFPSAGIVWYLHPIFRTEPNELWSYLWHSVSGPCSILPEAALHVRSIVSLSLAATGSSPDPSGQVRSGTGSRGMDDLPTIPCSFSSFRLLQGYEPLQV